MTANKIPAEVRNSCLQECIDEYVRSRTHRKMLADWYFTDLTMDGLAEKYHLSVTRAKEVVREIGGPTEDARGAAEKLLHKLEG